MFQEKNSLNKKSGLKSFVILLIIILLNSLILFIYSFNRETQKEVLVMENKEEINENLKKKIEEMTRGYPIEKMAGLIATKDEKVAALIVSIAKKESDWGKRVPLLNGRDCYNYWGYREKRERMGTDGHTCFNNPRDAINTVGNRISELVYKEKLDTPSKMIAWKCGSSCASHSEESVKKWISDVDWYFQKLVN